MLGVGHRLPSVLRRGLRRKTVLSFGPVAQKKPGKATGPKPPNKVLALSKSSPYFLDDDVVDFILRAHRAKMSRRSIAKHLGIHRRRLYLWFDRAQRDHAEGRDTPAARLHRELHDAVLERRERLLEVIEDAAKDTANKHQAAQSAYIALQLYHPEEFGRNAIPEEEEELGDFSIDASEEDLQKMTPAERNAFDGLVAQALERIAKAERILQRARERDAKRLSGAVEVDAADIGPDPGQG